MLKVHSDKEVVTKAFREHKRDPFKNPRDFIDFLHKDADLVIYGKPNQYEWDILSKFQEGRGNALIGTDDRGLERCNDKIDHKNPYQVLFFNTSDDGKKEAHKIQSNHLLGFIDDYVEVFKKLSNDPFWRVGDKESVYEFSDWSEVLPDLPVSDIIITDPYLFAENDENNPHEENYYRILDEIARKYSLKSLIVLTTRVDQTLRKILEAESKKILGDDVAFYLLVFRKSIEHDRYIFMNYHYVNTGNSMNYFNEDGEVEAKSPSKIEVFPLCKEKNFIIAQDILRKLHESIENLKNDKRTLPRSITSNLFFYLDDNV